MRLSIITTSALALTAALAACSESDAGSASGAATSPGPAADVVSTMPADRGPRPAFVDEAGCIECHAEAAAAWAGSHHDLAMQLPTPETVLGDFDGARFEHFGVETRFDREGERFLVTAEGPDGEPTEYEVAYVFGVVPLQQYLLELEGGRLQCLTVAWDTEEERWFHLYPDERFEPGDPLHWTGLYQRWNHMCADCHSTDVIKGYDVATNSYTTTWSVIDVGCQACHGPGERHDRWAREYEEGAPIEPGDDRGLVVDYSTNGAHYEVDQCARCHARRHRVSADHEHGRTFLDDYQVEGLREGLYHADGQIRDEVYVTGSFLQSRMYAEGVRCTDCHDAHGLELSRPGDGGDKTCTECHKESPPVGRFPTLKSVDYTSEEHHHHPLDSEGARCVGCHMIVRDYMVVDPRHDHSFRIPRPDLTVAFGTPNACTDCHAEEGAAWSAEKVVEWYGEREGPLHWSEVLARGRRGDEGSPAELAALAADPEAPAIVRATALEYLSGGGPDGAEPIYAALTDPEPLVRATAAGLLDFMPPKRLVTQVGPLLTDPVRAVRTSAAKTLAVLPAESLRGSVRTAQEAAWNEYEAAQRADADTPGPHLNLGFLFDQRGRAAEAEREYRAAIACDAWFLPARFNLANLLNRQGRNDEAEVVLREGIERMPHEGELYYSLGLLLAEMGRIEDATVALADAADRLPDRARVRYNLGLALLSIDRGPEAERALLEASRIDPEDAEVAWALVEYYAGRREWALALPFAEALARILPEDPTAQQVLAQVRSAVEGG